MGSSGAWWSPLCSSESCWATQVAGRFVAESGIVPLAATLGKTLASVSGLAMDACQNSCYSNRSFSLSCASLCSIRNGPQAAHPAVLSGNSPLQCSFGISHRTRAKQGCRYAS